MNSHLIAYRGFYIDPMTIEKITLGNKTFDGFTSYAIRTDCNNTFGNFVYKIDKETHEPHIATWRQLKSVKHAIDKIIEKNNLKGEKYETKNIPTIKYF